MSDSNGGAAYNHGNKHEPYIHHGRKHTRERHEANERLPSTALSKASCTSFSDSESKADVASSNNRILGCLIKARAMAIRCFWPPDNCEPWIVSTK
ncbi:hypothetical protein BC938DRAFT_480879 [Jimgerdemannia flammicorona]|uniref:Uncharacterized protein n=1 Tax=Jimgerdemannia flammicorona TaxID=994334 RepID=A0A433QHF1_9FUNG|nr:hypothetical protein BC938DRAFT_480879 [Jimgerdemannia flammicorona]